jgi:DNA invertase Pin-like site-specific DNA recombinase
MTTRTSPRVALYARVSTDSQTVDNQLLELRQAGQRLGWQIVGEFIDAGISGAKGIDARPQLAELMRQVTRGQVDLVAAWSVDRLGRSLADLVQMLQQMHARNCGLYLHVQGIDTSTPAGKAMFQMMGTFAEFERSMIVERIKTGLARAKASGKRLGRPQSGPELEAQIRALRAQGLGIHRIRQQLGCGASVVQRVLRAAAEAA